MSKLEGVSHEMLVLRFQHVSSGVSGFAVSVEEAAKSFIFQCTNCENCENWRGSRIKCLFWSSNMSRLESLASPCLWRKLQDLSFSNVSNCQNWRESRTKCLFWGSNLSRPESLVFLWLRHVCVGEAAKPFLFEGVTQSFWLCHVYGGSCNSFPFSKV